MHIVEIFLQIANFWVLIERMSCGCIGKNNLGEFMMKQDSYIAYGGGGSSMEGFNCAVDRPSLVVASRSTLHCATMCKRNRLCQFFNWKESRTCELYFFNSANIADQASGCSLYMSVAKLGCANPGLDLAYTCDSSMSSEALGSSELVVDGVSTNCTGVYRSCTEAQPDPWFAVDLGTERSVGYVNIIKDATGHGPTTITAFSGHTYRLAFDGTVVAMDLNYLTSYQISPAHDVMGMRCDGSNPNDAARCLIGSEDGYSKSNRTWKCATVLYGGWFYPGYDCSWWPNAVELAPNDGSIYPQVGGISSDAKWITSSTFSQTIYCIGFFVPQLHDFRIGLSNVNPFQSPPTPNSYQICHSYSGTLGTGMSINVTCASTAATYRYVIVQIPGESETLCLCGVQVYQSQCTAN